MSSVLNLSAAVLIIIRFSPLTQVIQAGFQIRSRLVHVIHFLFRILYRLGGGIDAGFHLFLDILNSGTTGNQQYHEQDEKETGASHTLGRMGFEQIGQTALMGMQGTGNVFYFRIRDFRFLDLIDDFRWQALFEFFYFHGYRHARFTLAALRVDQSLFFVDINQLKLLIAEYLAAFRTPQRLLDHVDEMFQLVILHTQVLVKSKHQYYRTREKICKRNWKKI